MSDRVVVPLVMLLLLPAASAIDSGTRESEPPSSTTAWEGQVTDVPRIIAHLAHRDLLLDPLPATGEFDGTWIVGRQGPLPTTWLHELEDSEMDCTTFVPPSSFLCHVNQMDAA